MGKIDEMSSAIGALQADVRYIRSAVDQAHAELHPRILTLEASHNKRQGVIMGISGLSGAASGALLTGLGKAFLAKMGMG